MADRNQSILVSRQAILLVTAMGVGLLTLTYVLGVQVGKQSAALRKPLTKTVDEELKELPEPMSEQMKHFEPEETTGTQKTSKPSAKTDETKTEAKRTEESKGDTKKSDAKKPDTKKSDVKKDEGKKDEGKWTLQFISTSDATEAKLAAEKAKAAGYTTTILKDKGQFKVRLTKPGSRSDMDSAAAKLKDKGLKPFPVKVE